MSNNIELESRLERLETALRDIDARLKKLERRAGGGQAVLPVQPPPVEQRERNLLGVAGICSLILGGAFVLRALTESHMIPPLAGAILGLAYAAFWIWRGDRYYASIGAIIAFPLIWETTTRFHIIDPVVAAVLIAAFGVLFLRRDPVLAWVGSGFAIVAAFAVGASIATLLAISVIGAATAFFRGDWEFAAWPAALASNILALILIVMHPPGVAYALLGYAALWTVLPVQSAIAALIGGGGATYLMIANHTALAASWAAIGLAAAAIARQTSSRTIAVQSLVWIIAATALAPYAGIAGIGAFFLLRWREERLVALMAFAFTVFMGINAVVSAPLVHTLVLVSFAALLAVVPVWETRVLSRIALVAGGLQILVEDLRLGSAGLMVIALALYGAALVIVSRLGRWDVRKLKGVA